jgi:hypothetical protein
MPSSPSWPCRWIRVPWPQLLHCLALARLRRPDPRRLRCAAQPAPTRPPPSSCWPAHTGYLEVDGGRTLHAAPRRSSLLAVAPQIRSHRTTPELSPCRQSVSSHQAGARSSCWPGRLRQAASSVHRRTASELAPALPRARSPPSVRRLTPPHPKSVHAPAPGPPLHRQRDRRERREGGGREMGGKKERSGSVS